LDFKVLSLQRVLRDSGRSLLEQKQLEFFGAQKETGDLRLFAAGDESLLARRAVSIVGTRSVSDEGRARAQRLARELASNGVVVMSGLAKGVDRAAHEAAISVGGSTIAVIGTPLSKAYPAENADLQETIYREHLLVSPFAEGEDVFKSNFPQRNRVMAALSEATVIIEASDTSGTLHQAAECRRLGRWLFIAKSVADDPQLTWPSRFLGKERTAVLVSTNDVLTAIGRHGDD
jgi:DNA processing protein